MPNRMLDQGHDAWKDASLSRSCGWCMQIVVLCTHWSACGFYYMARLSGFDPELLVGTNQSFFLSLNDAQQYIYSIYWAVQTLTSSEYGNPAPGSLGQTISASARAVLFMAFNIALGKVRWSDPDVSTGQD